ncbi:hypothetical protein [Kribbella speibonae]|uniref:Uncharacterized protein n=1 Tax=Kribbella speibonae TaxID=1572660 RepID=A0A4R0IZE9_9ACTN|nr:hypothetical protein [Kribbella speibonae]TCC34205.1 hypothetical protein E0H92_29735 [Kribbella speibonae]
MRLGWGIAGVVLLLAGCGTEEPTTAEASYDLSPTYAQATATPSGWQSSPAVNPPRRTPIPPGANAEELSGMRRLQAPDRSLFPPRPGEAQVIFACTYEEGSAQWDANALNHLNTPGATGRSWLNAMSYDETIKRLGRGTEHVTEPDFYLQAYTRDSWPVRELVTVYSVKRSQLSKLNLVIARNEYAMGCAYDRWLDTRMVQVSLYAPWRLEF